MMGSDLIPGLSTWHEQMVTHVNFIIFDRKGYEDILDPAVPKTYPMPTNYVAIKAADNLIGMISSTEVRKRITEAKHEEQQAAAAIEIKVQDENEEEEKTNEEIKST